MKLIFELPVFNQHQARSEIYSRFRFDYTDLFELALSLWDALEFDDHTVLHAAVETFLATRLSGKRLTCHAYLAHIAWQFSSVLQDIHCELVPTINPHLLTRNLDTSKVYLELVGWCGRDPIVRVGVKPMLNDNDSEV